MRVAAEAIVTNELNEALFVLRDDTRTWTPPGGAAKAGEQPTEALVREVAEETGLNVLPVRLVALYYRPDEPDGFLLFTFRCLQEGGKLQPSGETPTVGFMKATPPPSPMLSIHEERLRQALAHDGGPPYWGRQPLPAPAKAGRWLLYRLSRLRQALGGTPVTGRSPWSIAANTIIRDDEGRVLWLRRTDHDVWNLPGGGSRGSEPPWETAVRETREETGLTVRLTDLAGVYTKPQQVEIVLTFNAEVAGGRLRPNKEAVGFAYFAPGDEPPNTVPKQIARVADAVTPGETTIFRQQTAPSTDLETLASRENNQKSET